MKGSGRIDTEGGSFFKSLNLEFCAPFNIQGHIGTGPQYCHLWGSLLLYVPPRYKHCVGSHIRERLSRDNLIHRDTKGMV